MWIFGGFIANMIFGPDKPKKRRVEQPVTQTSYSNPAYTPTATYAPIPANNPKSSVLVCNGCGFSNETNALYCVECGTSLKISSMNSNY